MSLRVQIPLLTDDQYADIAAALRTTAKAPGVTAARDKRRLQRIAGEGALMEFFIGHAYVRYLHEGGVVGDATGFVQWVTQWVSDPENLQLLLQFLTLLFRLFSL